VDLLFGFVALLFGFVVVDLLNRWFYSLGLCLIFVFLVEIKADRHPPEPNPTQPVAFHGRRRVWNFSTRSDQVGCGLDTNPTQTDPWTALDIPNTNHLREKGRRKERV